MKLEIDTTRKAITILEETSVLEVMNFLKSLELEDYKIVSKHTTSSVEKEKGVQYIPYPNTPWLEPKYPSYPVWIYDPYSQPTYTT